jgi:hypothetical protein
VLGGPFIGNSECQLKRGSETGHPLFGSSFREPGGGFLSEGPEGYEGRLWRWGISIYGGSVRQPGESAPTGDFVLWLKGALGVERLTLWELC